MKNTWIYIAKFHDKTDEQNSSDSIKSSRCNGQ